MFDLGWAEMAIIMLVALIVIGPKDLPKVARTVGQWTGKARALARDFQRSLDDMAREAELDEIKKSIDKAGRFDVKQSIKDMVDPEDEFDRAFDMDEKMKKSKPKPALAKASNVKSKTAASKSIAAPKSTAKSPADDGAATAEPEGAERESPSVRPAAEPGGEKAPAEAEAGTPDRAAASRG